MQYSTWSSWIIRTKQKMEKEKVWLLHFEKKQNVRRRKHQMPQKWDICAWPFLALCRTQESFPVHVFSPKVHTIQYIWTPRSIHKPSPISTGKRYHLSSLPFRFDPSSARMLAQPSSVPSHLPFFPSPSFVACSCHSNSLPHLVFWEQSGVCLLWTSEPSGNGHYFLSNRFFLSFACHNSSQASLAQSEGSSRIGRSREATELCSDESGAAEQRRWRVVKSRRPKSASCHEKSWEGSLNSSWSPMI